MRSTLLLLAAVTLASSESFSPLLTPGRAADAPATTAANATREVSADEWLRPLIAPCFAGDGSGSIAAHERIEKKYISPELQRLMAADAADSKRTGEVTRMDFDWIVNSQEVPEKWSLGKPVVEGKHTLVPVSTGYGKEKPRIHHIVLERTASSWMIVDARYGEGQTLLKILNAPLP
ncbi:MAG: hypothetical protein ACAI35_10160 [Candidatus Methylacidiphilales bacterium]|nr:hypothetical protein [Candidatus Methylacidiphilales bacterium]